MVDEYLSEEQGGMPCRHPYGAASGVILAAAPDTTVSAAKVCRAYA
jgi:hypothetical protein